MSNRALAITTLSVFVFLFLVLEILRFIFLPERNYTDKDSAILPLLGASLVSYLVFAVIRANQIFVASSHTLESRHELADEERFRRLSHISPSQYVLAGCVGFLAIHAFGIYVNGGLGGEWYFFYEESKDVFVVFQRLATTTIGVLLFECLYVNYRLARLVADIPEFISIDNSVSSYRFDPILNSNFQCTLLLLGFIFIFSFYAIVLPQLQGALTFFIMLNVSLWFLLIALPTYVFERRCTRLRELKLEGLRNQASDQYHQALALDLQNDDYYDQARKSLDKAKLLNSLSDDLSKQRSWSTNRNTYFKTVLAVGSPVVSWWVKIASSSIVQPFLKDMFM